MKYCEGRSLVEPRCCEASSQHAQVTSVPAPAPWPATSAPLIPPRSPTHLSHECKHRSYKLHCAATPTAWALDMTEDNEYYGWQQEGSSHLPGSHEEIPWQKCSQTKNEENQPDSLVPAEGTERFRAQLGAGQQNSITSGQEGQWDPGLY